MQLLKRSSSIKARQRCAAQIKAVCETGNHQDTVWSGAAFWVLSFKRDINNQKRVAIHQAEVWKPGHLRTAEGAGRLRPRRTDGAENLIATLRYLK